MWRNLYAFLTVMRDARASAVELRRIVHRRLQRVLVSAYTTVPHYRQIMQHARYDPTTGYSGLQDLRRLPILTRKDLQSLNQRLVRQFRRKGRVCHAESTSGSVGLPVTVYRNAQEQALHIAKWMRVLFTNGYRAHQRVMAFCHPLRMDSGRCLIQRLGLLRRKGIGWYLPTQRLTDQLFSYRPHVLYGNRCHMELVALDMKERGLCCDFLTLLVVTGEVVHASTRRLLRESFGVDPVESYGSVEMGVMAYETPARGGLHLCEDQTVFEFLDDKGHPVPAGEAGRVIVTDLSQTLMPLIRYDQGDLAVFCERETFNGDLVRRLQRIIGRDDDYILMPDGSRRAYDTFSDVIVEMKGIDQFRIVQQTTYQFRVEVVAVNTVYEKLKGEIMRLFEAQFPRPYRFSIHRVHRIEPDPSGKIRKVISELTGPPNIANGPGG